MVSKTRDEVLAFLQSRRCGVIATATPDGRPEAALVDIATTAAGEIVFETTSATRKFANLGNNPRAALVAGWDDEQTLQIDGIVDMLAGSELARLRDFYLSVFPQKASHPNWPGNHYFRLRPRWMRFSDYHMPRAVEEFRF
jgi:pyridoxine/pyridoxamine 5'-phosphate oxidase